MAVDVKFVTVTSKAITGQYCNIVAPGLPGREIGNGFVFVCARGKGGGGDAEI